MSSASITVVLLVAGGLVFATRYRDMIAIETLSTQLTHLEGQILRLDEVLAMSARMAAATGDPQWEHRYHEYDAQQDAAIAEATAIAPDEVRGLAEAAKAADRELDRKEAAALALARQGMRSEARAVFDASYDALAESREHSLADLMTGVGRVVARRVAGSERSLITAAGVGAAAMVFLVLLWVHLLRLIRRYVHDRSEAEAQLRKAQATLEARVEDRTREVAASREQYRSLVENIEAIPFEWDPAARRMVYLAPQAAKLFGRPIEALTDERDGAGFLAHAIHDDERDRLSAEIERLLADPRGGLLDCRMVNGDGRTVHVRMFVVAHDAAGPACGVMLDVTQQRQLESELQQAQKFESVGRLAAGVAHEINTPVQFVTDSVQFLRDSLGDVMAVVGKHRAAIERAAAGEPCAELARAAQAAEADADMPYLAEQVPAAVDRALDGLSRVAAIVRSMKLFAHPRKDRCAIDLNESIASTLTIARGEYKYVADLETRFGELPPVSCFVGELNQVVLNLVINAAHAIGDVVEGTDQRGRITVSTRCDGDCAVIAISDTGTGIPPAARARIFEPFFTTKDIGKGTGQGLSHAHTVIVDKHRGSLTFETEIGAGTTFHIRIPIHPPDEAEADPVVPAFAADPAFAPDPAPMVMASAATGAR